MDVPSASSMELFIPSTGFLYSFPENIAHYIDSHGYCPPEGFQRAVLDCPPMKSMEYRKLLLANGGRLLVQPGESPAARQPSAYPASLDSAPTE
jgi:hypothetical protein